MYICILAGKPGLRPVFPASSCGKQNMLRMYLLAFLQKAIKLTSLRSVSLYIIFFPYNGKFLSHRVGQSFDTELANLDFATLVLLIQWIKFHCIGF